MKSQTWMNYIEFHIVTRCGIIMKYWVIRNAFAAILRFCEWLKEAFAQHAVLSPTQRVSTFNRETTEHPGSENCFKKNVSFSYICLLHLRYNIIFQISLNKTTTLTGSQCPIHNRAIPSTVEVIMHGQEDGHQHTVYPTHFATLNSMMWTIRTVSPFSKVTSY